MTDTRPYRFLNEAGYTEALLGWQPDEELFLIPPAGPIAAPPAAGGGMPAFRIRSGWPLSAWFPLDPPANST